MESGVFVIISVEEGIKRVVNNRSLYIRLLKSFKGREMVEQIIRAAQKEEYKEGTGTCHALRGTAANLAMHPLADITKKVEDRMAAGESPEDLLPSLKESIEEVEAAIAEIIKE